MQLPLYIVNAFTRQIFGGNPAAVCPLATWLPDSLLQQIAAQHNLSETAFFVATDNGFHIRWFTPEVEVALCGHATLASAFVLFNELDFCGEEILFTSESGDLTVSRRNAQITLDFPSQPAQDIALEARFAKVLGAKPLFALAGDDLVLVLENESQVAALQPDFALLKQLPYRGIVVTAPGDEADFVCRFFAPAVGINEDPVTGSAYTKLAPYWGQRLGKTILNARQISARGGKIRCELQDDRVFISGDAILYAKGEIYL